MKNKKTKAQAAKGKVKIKSLKLTKETIENLSDQDADLVKGGRYTDLSCPKGNS